MGDYEINITTFESIDINGKEFTSGSIYKYKMNELSDGYVSYNSIKDFIIKTLNEIDGRANMDKIKVKNLTISTIGSFKKIG